MANIAGVQRMSHIFVTLAHLASVVIIEACNRQDRIVDDQDGCPDSLTSPGQNPKWLFRSYYTTLVHCSRPNRNTLGVKQIRMSAMLEQPVALPSLLR